MAITTYRRTSTVREERAIILASLVSLCYGVGLQGSVAQEQGRAWWQGLASSSMPGEWLSGAVWTVMYALMAIAAWLVWTERDQLVEDRRFAMGCFLGQLLLTGLLPWALFVWGVPSLALGLLIMQVVAVQYTGAVFHRTRPLAGWLWLPYVLWTCFSLFNVVSVLAS